MYQSVQVQPRSRFIGYYTMCLVFALLNKQAEIVVVFNVFNSLK